MKPIGEVKQDSVPGRTSLRSRSAIRTYHMHGWDREKPVRIALCSDTHYWPGCDHCFGDANEQLQPWSDQIQRSLLADLQAAGPDLLLHLGDFSCGGGMFGMPEAEFCSVLGRTHQEFAALSLPYRAIPGNHDIPPGAGSYAEVEQILGLEPGLGATIDLAPARLVLLNVQGHTAAQLEAARPNDPVYGWASPQELARLDQALATAGTRPVLLFTHQLLRPWIGNQPCQDFYQVRNAEAVLAVLARHGNVRAVFQGHAHRLDVHQAPVGNTSCHFVVIPAVIAHPHAWMVLALTPDRLRVTMQALPLPEPIRRGCPNTQRQRWRAGRPDWQDFTIALEPG
jgi:hypothetical protein